MKKFALPKKPGMSQEKFDKVCAEIWEHTCSGGQYELVVRHLATVKGLQAAIVRGKHTVDLVIRVKQADGTVKTLKCEIKSGTGICAEVGAKFGDHITNYGPEVVYPNADLVIFAPGASDMDSLDRVLYESLVMTPQRFVQFAIENSGKRKHGFETAFKLAVDNKGLRAKNEAIPARPVLDKQGNPVLDEDGNVKTTKRGLDRWTDCIVLQEAYNDQLCEAVLVNAEDDPTLGQWLEDIGRYGEDWDE